MAAVVVTEDNTRIKDAENDTGYSNIGGGASGSAEAPFAYQGSNLFNRKVTSGTGAGFFYNPVSDSGSAEDMTVAGRTTMMVKCMVSDYGGLDATDGVILRLGSDGSNYYAFVLAGSDSPAAAFAAYRDIGGLLVIPVDPNENASYNDTGKDAGSPVLTAVDYFGYVCAFSASTAKNENAGLDAIDVGSGLYLVGGDGGDADGVWQDFADEDGNTVANRWGYGRNADGGGLLFLGNFRVGTDDDSTSTATEFTDTDAVVTWLDHLAAAGFNVATIDLGSASTTVTDGALHIGAGDTTNTDSRPDYICEGTSGSGVFSHQLRNFRNVEYTSACDVDGAIIECELLTQGGAEIQNSVINTNSLTSVACLQDPTFGTTTDLHDTDFVQAGAGHAIELATVNGTYTFTNLTFTGYGADTTDSAALDITAVSGTTTINYTGTAPTYKTAGATVSLVGNPRTHTVTNLRTGDRVVWIRVSDDTQLENQVESSGEASYTYTYGSDVDVDVQILSGDFTRRNAIVRVTLTDADASISAAQANDPFYLNPP